jgi:hypothetical protein
LCDEDVAEGAAAGVASGAVRFEKMDAIFLAAVVRALAGNAA